MPSNNLSVNLSIDPKRDDFYDRYDAAIALPICTGELDAEDAYMEAEGGTTIDGSRPAFTIPGPWRTEVLAKESQILSDLAEPSLASVLPILTVAGFVEFIHAILRNTSSSLWDRGDRSEALSAFRQLLLRSAARLADPSHASTSAQLKIISLDLLIWRVNYANSSPASTLEQTRQLAVQAALQAIIVVLEGKSLNLKKLKELSTELAQIQTLLSPQERTRLNPAYRGQPITEQEGLGDMARELGCQIARACLPFVQGDTVPRLPHLADDPFFSGAYEGAGLFEEAARHYRRLETLAGLPSHQNPETEHVYRQTAAVSDAYVLLQKMHEELGTVDHVLRATGAIDSALPPQQAELLFDRAAGTIDAIAQIQDLPLDSDPLQNPDHSIPHARYLEYWYYKRLHERSSSTEAYARSTQAAGAFFDALFLGGHPVRADWVKDIGVHWIDEWSRQGKSLEALAMVEQIARIAAAEQDPKWYPVIKACHEQAGRLYLPAAAANEGAARYGYLVAAYGHYERARIALIRMEASGENDSTAYRLSEQLLDIAQAAEGVSPNRDKRVWQGRIAAHQQESRALGGVARWTSTLMDRSEREGSLSQIAERVLLRPLDARYRAEEIRDRDGHITPASVRAWAARENPEATRAFLANARIQSPEIPLTPDAEAIALLHIGLGEYGDTAISDYPRSLPIAYADVVRRAYALLWNEMQGSLESDHAKGGTTKPSNKDPHGPGRRGR